MTLTIAGVPIGGQHPCRFVAELSNNANGSLARALRLIDAAKDAGSDFVKFQCYTPDELVELRGDGPAPEPWGSQGWTMRALYEKAQTPHDWFPALVQHCQEIGMPWFSSVFGPDSLALLESLECPAYKIARLDVHSGMRALLAGKVTIASFADRDTRPVFRAASLNLWCPEGYPQTAFDFDPSLWHYDGEFSPMFEGFSYHGTDPLPCVVAATLGAKIIEFHFMLDHAQGCAATYRVAHGPCECHDPSELESNVSITPGVAKQMIADVRRVEAMLV